MMFACPNLCVNKKNASELRRVERTKKLMKRDDDHPSVAALKSAESGVVQRLRRLMRPRYQPWKQKIQGSAC